MKKIYTSLTILFLLRAFTVSTVSYGQEKMWDLNNEGSIKFNLDSNKLPHEDHMAMSGQTVDMILEWGIDDEGAFWAERLIRWPMLRTIPDNTHASLQKKLGDQEVPQLMVNGTELKKGIVTNVEINGALAVSSKHHQGLDITRRIFPSVLSPAIIDVYTVKNSAEKSMRVKIPSWAKKDTTLAEKCLFGKYIIEQFIVGEGLFVLAPGESHQYSIVRTARKEADAPYYGNASAEWAAREDFLKECSKNLVLKTPDPILNRLFEFSKIRATESIFSTRGGLMHGPGGYNKYLAAIWANDQAEYINPFFPFLGNAVGNESALNSFRHFARYTNPEFKPIPSSIVAEGRGKWNGAGDRGDMAMIAYGAARFALSSGNPKWAEELWPLITWCLQYLEKKTLPNGVIASDSDELEGRFPAGEANLSTASLYYDALITSAYLGEALNKGVTIANKYRDQAQNLRDAIQNHFEATVEGYPTYQYYDGNTELRSWICFPLTVGIYGRAKGTVDALFGPELWTNSGLLTKSGTETVWDRSTLYALRGVFQAGYVDEGIVKLHDFSQTRLLGEHVPYVIEAYPEQNQSHLSAESGLYCRIFTEGLFGIRPTGFHSFECIPYLPKEWETAELKHVRAFGQAWNMKVEREGNNIQVLITDNAGNELYKDILPQGEVHRVTLYDQSL